MGIYRGCENHRSPPVLISGTVLSIFHTSGHEAGGTLCASGINNRQHRSLPRLWAQGCAQTVKRVSEE